MGTFVTLEEAREHFKNDRFATNAGMQIDELGEDYSVCSVTLSDDHKNAYGGVMGGAIFTLADLALSAAANNTHIPTVAQQVSCSFLSGAKGDTLIAQATCVKDGRTSCVYNIEVKDNTGRDVALFIGTGFKIF